MLQLINGPMMRIFLIGHPRVDAAAAIAS